MARSASIDNTSLKNISETNKILVELSKESSKQTKRIIVLTIITVILGIIQIFFIC